jgi:putative hemolysin
MSIEREPFDVRDALPSLDGGGWRAGVRALLDATLGLTAVRRRFHQGIQGSGEPFADTIASFGLTVDLAPFAKAVPKTGPVVIMANHPFGGADALTLGALCRAHRPDDTLLMANATGARLPVLGDYMLPVSILGGEDSARQNAPVLKRSLQHLRSGGMLAVFPSGTVAHWKGASIQEAPWSPHLAALAVKCDATVIPMRYFGRTPAWLHLAGGIHPLLRTALLPRVLLAMRGRHVDYAMGAPIAPGILRGLDAPTAFLRAQTLQISL